ncbi:MAG: hypothetical protein PHX21_13155 [bacterium]|nr:hypothetical protein [bacterium]
MPYKEVKMQRVIGAEIGNIQTVEVTYLNATQKDGAYTKRVIILPKNATNIRVRINFTRQEWVSYNPKKG